MIDILLKCILEHDFFSNLDAQSDFDKKIVTKNLSQKAGQVESFLS